MTTWVSAVLIAGRVRVPADQVGTVPLSLGALGREREQPARPQRARHRREDRSQVTDVDEDVGRGDDIVAGRVRGEVGEQITRTSWS